MRGNNVFNANKGINSTFDPTCSAGWGKLHSDPKVRIAFLVLRIDANEPILILPPLHLNVAPTERVVVNPAHSVLGPKGEFHPVVRASAYQKRWSRPLLQREWWESRSYSESTLNLLRHLFQGLDHSQFFLTMVPF